MPRACGGGPGPAVVTGAARTWPPPGPGVDPAAAAPRPGPEAGAGPGRCPAGPARAQGSRPAWAGRALALGSRLQRFVPSRSFFLSFFFFLFVTEAAAPKHRGPSPELTACGPVRLADGFLSRAVPGAAGSWPATPRGSAAQRTLGPVPTTRGEVSPWPFTRYSSPRECS